MERIEPGPGEESVWDYPRPPELEECRQPIRVEYNSRIVAETERSKRVLETSLAPVYYIPPEDVEMDYLEPSGATSFCEWKGLARYYDINIDNKKSSKAAWYYPDPVQNFQEIKNYVAFYPQKVDACYVGDEQAEPQEGQFYGGWITSDVVGPFKGGPGTADW